LSLKLIAHFFQPKIMRPDIKNTHFYILAMYVINMCSRFLLSMETRAFTADFLYKIKFMGDQKRTFSYAPVVLMQINQWKKNLGRGNVQNIIFPEESDISI
jgi:hypothetical protein